MRQLIDLSKLRAAVTAEKPQDKDNRVPYLFRCQNGGNCRQSKLYDSRLSASATAVQHGSFRILRQVGHQIRCGSVVTPSLEIFTLIITLHQSLIWGFLMECREVSNVLHAVGKRSPLHRNVLLYLYVHTIHFRLANALFATCTVTDFVPQ
jgi:hypothetical protein